jgi:hypothetical protein
MTGRSAARVSVVVAALALAVGTTAAVRATIVPRGPPLAIRDGVTLVVDREALGRVDLDLVHEELVPDWVSTPGGLRRLHLERVRRAVAPDANLLALLDRVAELEPDPVLHGAELRGVLGAWNQYLAKGGSPWRLGGEVVLGDAGARYLLKSYRVVTDEPTVTVGGATFPVEVRRRADPLGTPDTWLGRVHDHEDGIVLLLDRLTSFALDELWPVLDPELELSPLQRRFAPALRAELALHLSAEELRTLEETAADRYWMMRAVGAIHARHACGSEFTVSKLAWNGFSARDLTTFQRHAEGARAECPEVLPTEALVFATRSWHLQHTAGVRDALEHLVAVVGEGVLVHESRHAADDRLLDGQRIACIGCPPDTSHLGALEASAYLAGFADPTHGVVSLFQACRVADDASEDVRAGIAFLAERLAPGGCDGAPPADLALRAAALEREVFLRSEPAVLTAFPAGLPVSSEYRGR